MYALRFIRRARDLGFSMTEVSALVKLWPNRRLPRWPRWPRCAASLVHLAHACHGDQRPDCPILDELSGDQK